MENINIYYLRCDPVNPCKPPNNPGSPARDTTCGNFSWSIIRAARIGDIMRTRLIHSLVFVCVLLCLGSVSSAASKPFPQHKTYTPGTIQPDIVTQTQMDQATQDFYDYWKSSYLHQHPKISDQYYVLTRLENKGIVGKTHTVSRVTATAWSLRRLCPIRCECPNIFDGLYRYFKAHPSINNPYLMAWNQILDLKRSGRQSKRETTRHRCGYGYRLCAADGRPAVGKRRLNRLSLGSKQRDRCHHAGGSQSIYMDSQNGGLGLKTPAQSTARNAPVRFHTEPSESFSSGFRQYQLEQCNIQMLQNHQLSFQNCCSP